MTDKPATDAIRSADPDLTGSRFGDYQLLRRLGRGAMAEVYLAQQRSLRRKVAIKILKRALAKDESYIRRFHNEARAAASLAHANIVQIHEVGRVDGTHYIAQEYVPGQNLGQYLSRNGPLNVALAVAIMRQVGAALHKAGETGIVHRDIKPENIMLAASGDVKVADFGLARSSDGTGLNLTQVGITMGTPLYMSPEQSEGKPLDPRSDIYSFGVTCYHMLTGAPPFTGDSPLSVAVQHIKSKPARLESIRSDLPPGLSRIIHKMMVKVPDKRYQRPAEFLQDLRSLQLEPADVNWPADLAEWSTAEMAAMATARDDATTRLDSLMKTVSMQTVRPSKRRWTYVAIGAAAVAAFLVGVAIAYSMREPDLLQLSGQEQRELIEERDSAEDQFRYARLLNTEKGYASVAEYFPEDEYHVHLAKLHLGWLYLQPDYNEPSRALEIFEELSHLDDTQQYFRAAGMAGQAMVYHLSGHYERSQSKLDQLKSQHLEDELTQSLAREMQRLAGQNRAAMRRGN